MKLVTDAATASMAGTTGISVWYGYLNAGMAFILLILSILLTLASLWSWWEERKKKPLHTIEFEEIADTGSSEMDGLFYLE